MPAYTPILATLGYIMSPDGARQARLGGGSHAPIGAQLYSFREQAKRDPIAMMATARGFGITRTHTITTLEQVEALATQAKERSGTAFARVLIGADAWVLDKFVRVAGSKYQGLVMSFSKRSGL